MQGVKVMVDITDRDDTLKLKVKYFADVEPLKITAIGDCIDLRAAEDIEMREGEYRLIPLGVGMKLPEGYEAHLYPRSSTFKNFGVLLTNGVGIIDNSYSGDGDQWHFPAYAIRATKVRRNDRICQFRIVKSQPRLEIETVEHLDDVSRGGIGSTGVQ